MKTLNSFDAMMGAKTVGGTRTKVGYFTSIEGERYLMNNFPSIDTAEVLKKREERRRLEREQKTPEMSMKEEYPEEIKSDDDKTPMMNLEGEGTRKHMGLSKSPDKKKITSTFALADKMAEDIREKEIYDAELYSFKKTKDFNLYGEAREDYQKQKRIVTNRPKMVKELNTKTILIEANTDRRIRISSMANRISSKAPSVTEQRRQGMHQILGKAAGSKQSAHEMIAAQNQATIGAFEDSNNRGLFLTPAQARFGPLRHGNVFTQILHLKNEGIDLCRFTLRQAEDKRVRVQYDTGAVPMGISRKLSVSIYTTGGEPGRLETEFTISTKCEKLIVPVFAQIMGAEEFDNLNEEALRKNKRGILKDTLRVMSGPDIKREEDMHNMDSLERDYDNRLRG